MVKELDVLFVGPWERVVSRIGEQRFISGIEKIRKFRFVDRIVYSSSDPLGVVPVAIFDYVASTFSGADVDKEYIEGNTSYATSSHQTSPYIDNVKAGLQFCSSKFVIRVRSDLEFHEINMIFSLLKNEPNKIYIDYHPDHTLLIPNYLPDMFMAAKLETVTKMYTGDFFKNTSATRKLSINPFRFLVAGYWDVNYQYPEVLFWSTALRNIGFKKQVDRGPIKQLKGSFILYKSAIVLLNRNKLFDINARFNRPHRWTRELLFPMTLTNYCLLLTKHISQFGSKTLTNLALKIWKILT
jgi:hypothetical protein